MVVIFCFCASPPPQRTHLIVLIVEPGLEGLHHGVLGEGPRQPREVGDLRQGGFPHLLGQTALSPALPLSWRGVRGREGGQGGLSGRVGLLAEADVGVVVLQSGALSQPGPLTPQRRE